MQSTTTTGRGYTAMRIFGAVMIVLGIGGWWYNRQLAALTGQFYIKLCIFGPLGVAGGLLMAVRPDLAGPMRPNSTRAHKAALFTVIGLMAVVSGYEFFHLKTATARKVTYTPWTPGMGTPQLTERAVPVSYGAADMTFLGQKYHLASFNQKSNAMWEFIPASDSIENWNTMLTVIDRPDARSREELDRLAEGILNNYKSHNAKVLMAKTMQPQPGAVFNYVVAAFDEPAQHRYELNFVKMLMGPTHAVVMIYGVRVQDPRDYRTKAKEFLDRNSSEIGRALADAPVPDVERLPRRVF